MKTIGIIGGGQLGRMLFEASIPLDLKLHFYVRPRDEGVLGVAPCVTVGELTPEGLLDFASQCDVISFEHELTPPESLKALLDSGVILAPSAYAMSQASDKSSQRALFERLGAPTIPSVQVSDLDALRIALSTFSDTAVIKATRGGFDGRGLRFVDPGTFDPAGMSFAHPYLVEPLCEVTGEFAVVVVRDRQGDHRSYPPIATRQENGICVAAWAPATELDPTTGVSATELTVAIADELDLVGVLAAEFFQTPDGYLVNEIAPRVHNTGHLTIEAAATSQFENHLRAISGLPLGSTHLVSSAAMANLFGTLPPLPYLLPTDGTRLHLYGKSARDGRKVGHLTALAPTVEGALAQVLSTQTRITTYR